MITRTSRMLLIALALLGLAATAQAEWLGVGASQGTAPLVQTTELGLGRTEIAITLGGVETQQVEIDGVLYTRLMLPGHVQLLERGAPQVPYITTSLVIPDQGTPDVRITKSVYREFAVDPLAPSKGPILRTVDPKTVAHEFGPAYAGGVFPTEVAILDEPYLVRDLRGVNVRLYPVQWDVDRGVVRVLESVTVEVTTRGSGGVNSQTRSARSILPTFDALYAQKFDNYDPAAKYDLNSGQGPMLIVCYDAFVGAIQPFVDWKRQRGLDVSLVTTSSVGGTVGGIQTAIQQHYDRPEGLAFVILVGDGAQVPHYSGTYEGADDDTRFVRLNGTDVYPDALISRISATNPAHVSTQVTKFITYERDTAGDADWAHMATGIASNEGSPSDATRCDWLRDDLLAYEYTDVDRIYQGQGGTTAGITAAINEGRSLVNYLGHGSGTSWGSVYFTNSNVHALTNDAWPWIIDVACLNGGISAIGESFAEAWMRAGSPEQPHGCIGNYASSTSCPWVPPTLMQSEAVELLCAETSNNIGVLVHAGIMAVVDSYGQTGTGLQLIEQYNLFGDCSLMVRTASPAQMNVAHQPVVPLFSPTYDVDAGVPGATVTLSGNGMIYGTGTTDAGGQVTLTMTQDLDAIGDATLTVFGYNQETYVTTVQVVVPANVEIDPLGIPVGVTTPVTIIVTDPDTGDGMDVMIDVSGFGFDATAVQTDAFGRVTIDVTPEYGETLVVRGQEVGATYFMFHEDLVVTGAGVLGDPAVTAGVPAIGLDGALTPHIEGEITASIRNQGFTLFLAGGGRNDVYESPGTSLTVPFTPTDLSDVTATIASPGFGIFQQQIAVVEAFGTISGTVVDADAGQAPVEGARVSGFAQGADPQGVPLFDLVSGVDGSFAFADDLAVGYYDLYVEKFGYLSHQEIYFQTYGAATHGVALNQAPSGTLSGVVTSADLGTPLAGEVSIFRSDNGDLYDSATADVLTGAYTTGPLPFFDYEVRVTAPGHMPLDESVTIAAVNVTADFALAGTVADVLVLDDNSAEPRQVPAKFAADGAFLASGYPAAADRAAGDLVAALEYQGYAVVLESAAVSDPATWTQYGMVLVSAGSNTGALGSATFRADLRTYSEAGGRLMVEGGEVAYNVNYSDVDFMNEVLYVSAWNGDQSGAVAVEDPLHAVVTVPNAVTGTIANNYSGYGDADRATPADLGHMVCDWTTYAGTASVIVHDDDADPAFGQFVFFLFNYSSMGSGAAELLENAVHYLVGAPAPLDTTPVDDQRIPTALALHGNHPNPFNPKTVIRFALPATADVTLAVYDVRGQRVRTLLRDALEAGQHEAVWLGRDDTGRQVASGAYFYRLTAGGEQLVGKMLLVK